MARLYYCTHKARDPDAVRSRFDSNGLTVGSLDITAERLGIFSAEKEYVTHLYPTPGQATILRDTARELGIFVLILRRSILAGKSFHDIRDCSHIVIVDLEG